MFTLLWRDDEIAGRVYMQALFLFVDQLLKPHGEAALGGCLFGVMHKLTAMKYHMTSYQRTEAQLTVDYTMRFQTKPNENAESFDLICHFEAFMFQLKSALDLLVKLCRYVPLTEKFYVGTYTKSGQSLINELRERAKRRLAANPSDPAGESLEALAVLAESARDAWLREAVHLRGVLIHDRGARDFTFKPYYLPNGRIAARPPVYGDQPVVERMSRLYSLTVEYAQDFMAHALAIAAGPEMRLGPAGRDRAIAFCGSKPAISRFIKWGWVMDGGAVNGLFRT